MEKSMLAEITHLLNEFRGKPIPVREPMGPNDEVLGEMPMEARALLTIKARLIRKHDHTMVDFEHAASDDEKTTLKAESLRLRAQIDMINTAMWAEVKDSLGIWHVEEGLGLRGDFQVVKRGDECMGCGIPDNVMELLKAKIGGGCNEATENSNSDSAKETEAQPVDTSHSTREAPADMPPPSMPAPENEVVANATA